MEKQKINLALPTDKVVECKMWDKRFKILDFEEHKNDATEVNSKIICYTDGSKINNTTGCGYHIRRNNVPLGDHHCFLGKNSTVFQTEIVAISKASNALMIHKNQNIIIRSDSQAAINAIGKNKTTSLLVKECVEQLNKLSKRNKVTLQWIKAHVGHVGNEAADKNAKNGADQVEAGPEPFLPLPPNFQKQISESECSKIWLSRWEEDPKFCIQTKLWFKKPTHMFISFLSKDRNTVGKIIQFITGHCNLRKHQFRIGNATNPNCRLCNEAMETPWHLVSECPRLQGIREKYFHGPILHSFHWSPQVLLGFCKESSIWSMLDGQE